MSDQDSAFRRYSIGVVVEHKEHLNDYIKVTPMETQSHMNGPLKDESYQYDIEAPDAQGVKRKSKAHGAAVLVAKWHAGSSGNRITAPDVRAGESVQIYRFADTDRYYWDTLMREPELRRQEHVVHAYSNLKDGIDPFDRESSYWSEISTRNKNVQFKTAKNDGEPFIYNCQINTRDGTLAIEDDDGNYVHINSSEGTITVHANRHIYLKSGGCTVHVNGDGDSISMSAPDTINIRAGSNVNIAAGSNIRIAAPDIYVSGDVHDG